MSQALSNKYVVSKCNAREQRLTCLQLADLHARTKAESLLLVCRGQDDHFNGPMIYTSSDKGKQWVDMILNVKYADIANKFEAFMLLGLEGETAVLY